jgi:L-2-hydroxyglutarate oxidase LhgO
LPEKNTQGLSIHSTLDMAGQVRFGPDSEYVDERNYDVSPSKREIFAAAIATYFPAISAEKLQPAYSGIRPKLAARGEPAADFIIENYEKKGTPGLIQLFGIESPGLTASLAIADEVVQLLS